MSLAALRASSVIHRRSCFNMIYMLQRPMNRTFVDFKQQAQKDHPPPHLIRKGKRRIPEPYLKILKQVPPRHKDYFGLGIIAFVFIFTFVVNGVYMWQAYTLKDRLKAQGVIEGSNDERWTNVSTYRKN